MAFIDEIMLTDIAHKKDFIRVENQGDISTISGLNNYKEAIIRRVMTTKGTIIHRPGYGVGLKSFQNAPNTITSQRKLALEVKKQVELDPRTEAFLGLRIGRDDLEPDKLTITIRITPVGFKDVDITFSPFQEGI